MNWILSPILIVVIFVIFAVLVGGFLYLRKRKKLIFPAVEFVDLGSGRVNFNFLGMKAAGWFGRKSKFFGLWDSGDKVMKLKTGEYVIDFSEEDFHEVNGRRGIVFYRNPANRQLFPINDLSLTDNKEKVISDKDKVYSINNIVVSNKDITATIADATFIDEGARLLQENERETTSKLDKILPILLFIGVIIFALVSIIVITQMVTKGQAKAADVLMNAGKVCSDYAKTSCQEIMSHVTSTAP